MTAELWAMRHPGASDRGAHIHESAWPVADPSLLVEESVTLVVQVNGKVRDRIEVAADADEDACVAARRWRRRRCRAHLGDGEPRKVIARPPKLVNIVV